MSKKQSLKMLSEAELHKLNDQRLANVLKSARAVKCSNADKLDAKPDLLRDEEFITYAIESNNYFHLVKKLNADRVAARKTQQTM